MFKINDRVRLKYDNKENPSLTVRSDVGGQRFLCISDCGQRMVWATTHELELVESNFDLKQAIREVLLSDQFVKTFAEAMSSKLQQASVSAEQPEQPIIKQSSTTEPPEGWRWLEVGEVIRRGDLPWEDGWVYATEPIMLGMALQEHWKPMIRRNQFEVGEKVVYTIDNTLWTFTSEIDDGPRFPKSAWVTRVTGIGKISQRICVNHLAPYIEETNEIHD